MDFGGKLLELVTEDGGHADQNGLKGAKFIWQILRPRVSETLLQIKHEKGLVEVVRVQ